MVSVRTLFAGCRRWSPIFGGRCGRDRSRKEFSGPVIRWRWKLRRCGPLRSFRVFRSTTDTVTVNVSVKRGNSVVANLAAADFRLTDNGVAQTVEAVSIESVPMDVTLFLDTSGSTAGKLDEMQRDVQAIVQLLRPGDRFRLLTIGDAVYPSVPWVDAGTKVTTSFAAVGGISLIHDALMLGLLHRPDPGRRHLVVGMTDREDCGSVVPADLLLELAGRSDAVLHLVDYSGSGATRITASAPARRGRGRAG